ncbi:MAG: amidohydrolase [Steroidobacteraceae bacterium]
MRLTLVQQELRWEDRAANLQLFSTLLEPLAGSTDLVILPETFATAYSMATEQLAEDRGGESLRWMQGMAQRLNAAVTGSLMVRDGGHVYNRLYFVVPDAPPRHYDKRHLFRMAGEHRHYRSGSGQLLLEWRGWKIAPMVCYDLRFPVWCRRTAQFDYDLQLFVANWPARRIGAWSRLLAARAIENLAYCAGVNRLGVDGNGIVHTGCSAAFDYLGEPLVELQDRATVETVELSLERLHEFREKFPVHLDADGFNITL